MLSIRPTEANAQTRPFANAKTPGRARTVIVQPRTLMKENASRHGPLMTQTGKPVRTVPFTPGPKGKDSIQPQRLFDDNLPLKPSTSQTTAINRLAALVDKTNKTPFPKRQPFPVTPLPAGKLDLGVTPTGSLQVPGTILRPSSTRKSLRIPRKSFETPDPQGRRPHWDVSDGEISVEIVSSEVDPIVEEELDDDDEIEYMAPPVPEPDYDPGFELPDFKQLGAAVMAFSRCPTIGDEPLVDWDSLHEIAEEVPDERQRIAKPDPDDPFPARPTSCVPTASRTTSGVPKGKGPVTTTVRKPAVTKPATITSRNPATSRPSSRPSVAARTTSGLSKPRTPIASRPTPESTRPTITRVSGSRPPTSRGPISSKRPITSRPIVPDVEIGGDLPNLELDEFRFEV